MDFGTSVSYYFTTKTPRCTKILNLSSSMSGCFRFFLLAMYWESHQLFFVVVVDVSEWKSFLCSAGWGNALKLKLNARMSRSLSAVFLKFPVKHFCRRHVLQCDEWMFRLTLHKIIAFMFYFEVDERRRRTMMRFFSALKSLLAARVLVANIISIN